MKRGGIVLFLILGMLCFAGINNALATTINLTLYPYEGSIYGGNFYAVDQDFAGRGVFPTFLAIQGSGQVEDTEGFNTDWRPLSDIGMDYSGESGHTHSVLISDMGMVSYGGTNYWSFILDIDQAPGLSSDLSLADLKIYLTNDPQLKTLTGLTPFYDLDRDDDNEVLMDYSLNIIVDNGGGGGSGKADMIVDIPIPDVSGFTNVVLYSMFFDDNDGPQEWSYLAGQTPVPEPATMLLLGTGLVGLAGFRKKFKK